MKPFKFTLQTLLNVRQSQEDALKAKLAEERAKLAAMYQALDDARTSLVSEQERFMKESMSGAVRASDFEMYDHFFEYMKGVIAACEEAAAQQEKACKKAQDDLIKALQEKKVLEKLKEKQYKEYLAEVKLEDDKMIDDFMSYNIVSS